jgi:transcriptional regulator with XRE-family HTH domain
MQTRNAPSPEPSAHEIGALLRQWRCERGLSQTDLATRAKISPSTLSRWEAGKSKPGGPELEATLQALAVSPAQVYQALLAARTPGSRRRLSPALPPDEKADDSFIPSFLPPVGGDLLRALRLRRGMPQAQLASLLGVPQNAVARWERSETWPDATRLNEICFHLNAYPEELHALTVGRFSLTGFHQEEDPDALHQAQWKLRLDSHYAPESSLKDLRFLALEAHLHELLFARAQPSNIYRERLQQILSWTYSRHAQYLEETGRYAEAVTPARHALSLQKPLWETHNQEGWVPALLALATAAVRQRGGTYRRGLMVVQPYLSEAYSSAYRAWMLTDMAQYALGAGLRHKAIMLSQQALETVMHGEGEYLSVEQNLRRRDHAALLLAAGNAAEAERYLASEEWAIKPEEKAKDQLLRAEVMLALQDNAGAQGALSRAYTLIGLVEAASTGESAPFSASRPSPLRVKADILTRQFGGKSHVFP